MTASAVRGDARHESEESAGFFGRRLVRYVAPSGGHWRRRRPKRRGRNPQDRSTGSAHHRVRAGSDSICANGQNRPTGSEQRRRDAKARPTASRSTHVRPSSVACSPNHMGQGRLRHWQLEIDHLHGSHRDRRRVRQVCGGAWNRGWSRWKRRSHRRRSRMDLESGGRTLSWRCADRRCLSRAAAFVGLASPQYRNDPVNQQGWMKVHQKRLLDNGKLRTSFSRCALWNPPTPMSWKEFAPRRITLSGMASVCVIQSFVVNT